MIRPYRALMAYSIASPVYGAWRKMAILNNANKIKYDSRKNAYVRVPMLVSEKALVTTASAILAPLFAINWLICDVMRAEIILRGLKLDDYDLGFRDQWSVFWVMS